MRLALLALTLAGVIPGGVAADEAVARGEALSSQCRTCHGRDGRAAIPIAPNIGGEDPAYIAAQLTAFRKGTREHEMMSVVAKSLTDAQIADLAAYYGHFVATGTANPRGPAPEACTACHGADGIAQVPEAPNLAGETAMYVDTQLKAFRLGKRVHEIMSGIAKDMSDADIRAAADYYAGTKLTITAP